MKNNNGRCAFHNGIGCSIYAHRPEGCRLYPIIYDMDKRCATFDNECPYRDKFKMFKNKKRRLLALIKTLECEKSTMKEHYIKKR